MLLIALFLLVGCSSARYVVDPTTREVRECVADFAPDDPWLTKCAIYRRAGWRPI
jgi:uncharacterized protein YcfL